MKLHLPNGATYGIDSNGNRICTGSQAGRRNLLPFQFMGTNAEPIKLQMERLRWVSYDYDMGGAYWGRTKGDFIFCAWKDASDSIKNDARVFVRATSRKMAKRLVREHFPKAKFYR